MSTITKVKKRDQRIVVFDRSKIEHAILRACIATKTPVSSLTIEKITDDVVEQLGLRFIDKTPDVESIQDIVEQNLMSHDLFQVAKAYIVYRKEHAEKREQLRAEEREKIERSEIKVTKRNGSLESFDIQQIAHFLSQISKNTPYPIDTQGVLADTKTALFDGISTKEINQALIMSMRGRIERDPVYSVLAAKTLVNNLYKDILGMYDFEEGFEKAYKQSFEKHLRIGVNTGRLDSRLLMFDIDDLSNGLRPERDCLLQYLGMQTLYDRYFLRDFDQTILETPQYFWMRVAMGIAINEKNKAEKAKEFYEAMSQMYYTPSTPTLFHSGTKHPQMSSCYVTTVEDDLTHIFKAIGDNAELSKWSGGLGNDWSNVRGTGSLIKSTNVGSQGVIPFLKIVDSTTAAINRSGKRRGATCVYLETWHYDIEDFLELRKNTGDERRRTHDINTANWIPDLFMKRVQEDKEWTLFSPDETPDLHHLYGKKFEEAYEKYEEKAEHGEIKLYKKIQAKELWRKMITQLFETGHPWITFKDSCNIRSPQDHVGVVHSSNLCTEITLNTSSHETAVCNLGSINLSNHISDGALNKEKLAETISVSMRMLDNVIDLNYYPTKEARNANLKHRPVGLGVMGFADVLYKLNLSFASDEAVAFSDEMMEFVSYHAILSSSRLAQERGVYSSYRGSKWDRGIFPIDTITLLEQERGRETGVKKNARMDWFPVREQIKKHGMRNSNTMAIAPTATIANINGSFPSIEPIYKNVYTKSNFSGEFTIINDYLVDDLKKLNLWGPEMIERVKFYDGSAQQIIDIPVELKEKYKEVFEIDPLWIIQHAAYRGKWIDQSQSVNVFIASVSGLEISNVYMTAWEKGLKTTYYLRTLGASAIEKSTIDINKKFTQTSVPASENSLSIAEAVLSSAVADQIGKKAPAPNDVCSADKSECEACQ